MHAADQAGHSHEAAPELPGRRAVVDVDKSNESDAIYIPIILPILHNASLAGAM